MHLLRCTLTLHDTLFFATREMGVLYETERYLHNYALSYALFDSTIIQRPSAHTPQPEYAADLALLNARGIYVTPCRPKRWDYLLITWKIGQVTYYRKSERFGESGRNYPANYGRAKELAPESEFECYVLSEAPLELPRWIRLGKWMSKAEVVVEEVVVDERNGPFEAACALNPLDLPDGTLHACDIVSMPPSSLVVNARLDGRYYFIDGLKLGLPAGMRYTVPEPPTPAGRAVRQKGRKE